MSSNLRVWSAEEALDRMADRCSRGESCESEIRDKLRQHGVSARDANDIVEYLYENNFLNHRRFAEAFVSDKIMFNGWGKWKIKMALAEKRIEPEIAAEALAGMDKEAYSKALLRVAKDKSKGLNLNQREDYLKFVRSMSSRGFDTKEIAQVRQYLLRSEDTL